MIVTRPFLGGLAVATVLLVVLLGLPSCELRVIDPESCITVCNARVSRYTPFSCECKR